MNAPEKELVAGLSQTNNPQAYDAYRYALYGLIPVAGLVFGTLAITRGITGRRAAYLDSKQEGLPQAWAGIVLGALEVLTNGAGLVFIAIGVASLMG